MSGLTYFEAMNETEQQRSVFFSCQEDHGKTMVADLCNMSGGWNAGCAKEPLCYPTKRL